MAEVQDRVSQRVCVGWVLTHDRTGISSVVRLSNPNAKDSSISLPPPPFPGKDTQRASVVNKP
ncbi:hypothetical protein IE53DRAFT_384024, partial [Violaceomyces palustris]